MCGRVVILCKLPKPMAFAFFNPSRGAERALFEAKLTNVLPQTVSVGKTGQVNWRLRPPKQELCDGLTKVVSLYLVQLEEPRTHPTKLVEHLCVPLPTAAFMGQSNIKIPGVNPRQIFFRFSPAPEKIRREKLATKKTSTLARGF